MNSVSVSRPGPNIIRITVDCGTSSNTTMPIVFSADHHWDNPKSKHDIIKRHLDWARENEALVCLIGDTFCLMQGKNDRRGSKSDIRPEHNTSAYFNAVLDTAYDFYSPYADLFAMISPGNHETAITKHNEINITNMFVRDLNRAGGNCQVGKYSGFIQIMFKQGRASFSYWVYYNHGSGGGGPVTKGVIQTNRTAVYQPDADLVVKGHIHESWMVELMRERVSSSGHTWIEPQVHLQLPTMKEEYLAHEGFHIEKGRPPKPLGSYAVNFHSYKNIKRESHFDVVRLR